MLSVAKQSDEDMRTIGELFYVMVGEVADMTFRQAMMILQEAMLASIKTVFHMTEEQIQAVAQNFVDRLPEHMRGTLQESVAWKYFLPAGVQSRESLVFFMWEVWGAYIISLDNRPVSRTFLSIFQRLP